MASATENMGQYIAVADVPLILNDYNVLVVILENTNDCKPIS